MERSPISVIKKQAVEMSEPYSIGDGNDGAATPQAVAQIVQQDDNYAVVEVVCGCGRSIKLRCNYAVPEGQAT